MGELIELLLHLAVVIAQLSQGLPAVTAPGHQFGQVAFGPLCQGIRAGCPRPLHPLLPLADLPRQLEQVSAGPLGAGLQVEAAAAQALLALALLLLAQQLLLGGVGPQKRLQLLLQLPF